MLSEATRQLAASQLAADVSVRDLGWHRLKDIEAMVDEQILRIKTDLGPGESHKPKPDDETAEANR